MEVDFANARLAKLLGSNRDLARQYGAENADIIKRRLFQLMNAESLEEARETGGRLHELKAERQGQLAMDLKHPFRLILQPAPPLLLKADGGLDWKAVNRVTLLK